jgi:signal transduction histidine kinase
MNKSLNESDRRVDPNIIDLAQSSYLKEVNNKYNKQREFVSLAAHELISPILPILGTLELIEYEFEESGKKEITLKREHFERLVRKRLERVR